MPDTTLQLRDGNNNSFPIKARLEPDGSYAFYHASDAEIIQPDNTAVGMIGTTLSKWSDGFSGPTLAVGQPSLDSLTKWNIVRNTGGMTIQQANGALVITTGTAVAEFLMVGKVQTTIPQNLIATLSMTARNASQEFRVGYLEVDVTGAPVANPNMASFFNNYTAVLLNGVSNVTAVLETVSGGNPTSKQITVAAQNPSTSIIEYALEVRPEDVTYQQALADSVVPKASTSARISSMVPNPLVRYAPFIWVRNTAATTSTAITIQRIISMDIQELQVEVGGGRGNVAASQAIPVVLAANAIAQTVNTNGSSVAISNAVMSGSLNLATVVKIMSTAAAPASTIAKATSGRVSTGTLTNLGTTVAALKFWNANATGNAVVGTTVPYVTIPLLPNIPVNLSDIFDQYGLSFNVGIAWAITGGVADLDTTALAAAQVVGYLSWA